MKCDPNESFPRESRLIARGMIATLVRVKEAVGLFEDGEISLEDALRRIIDALGSRKAA